MTRWEAIKFAEYAQIMADGKPDVQEFYKLAESALRAQQELESKLRVFESNEPMTNAQRIRAMSDEELASLLTDYSNNGGWVTEIGRKICYERIVEWLQQPAEEDDHA